MKTALAVLALSVPASAANIYVFSSGDPQTDSYLMQTLTGYGHNCTLGVQYMNFTGSPSLAGYHTVYLQASANWSAGTLPAAGATALRNWVTNGGRLVTSEWATYLSSPGGAFEGIASILPLAPSENYGSNPSTTFRQATPNAIINAGLPTSFQMPLLDFVGTELYTVAKNGATTYYTTAGGTQYAGLAGWNRGAGSVYSFSTTSGWVQLSNGFFDRVLSNVMGPIAPACYANCDHSAAMPVLNVQDFNCFLNRFAAADTWANCDHSTSPPIVNVLDFSCFLNAFAAGCPG